MLQQGLDFASEFAAPVGGVVAGNAHPPVPQVVGLPTDAPGQQAGRVEPGVISIGRPTVIVDDDPDSQQPWADPSGFAALFVTSEYAPKPAADKRTTPAINPLIQDR